MVIVCVSNTLMQFQPLFLGDSQIEPVHSYKYLGVTLVSDLSWSESICVKSKKLIGVSHRRFYGYADPSTIVILYLTLVRPRIWNMHAKFGIHILKGTLKNLPLCMSYKQWTSNYSDLLYLSNISTLGERRLF